MLYALEEFYALEELYASEEFAVQLNCEALCVLESGWISGVNKFSLP